MQLITRKARARVSPLAALLAAAGFLTLFTATVILAWPAHAQDSDDPPAQPTGLAASVASGVGVNLTWDDPSDAGITGYQVLRRDLAIHESGHLLTIKSDTGSAETSYTDATVEAGAIYVYRVKAINEHGVSERSKNARAQIPDDYEAPEPEPAPEDLAPSGLAAALVDGGGVSLSWEAPAENADAVTGYAVLRAQGDGELTVLEADTGDAGTSYTDDTATEAGTTYSYQVKALRGEKQSQASNRAEVLIPHDPEDLAPTNLTAELVDGGGVSLSWDAPAAEADSVTGYRILRGTGDQEPTALEENTAGAATSYTDDTATEGGATYSYRVKALRDGELSQGSNTASVEVPEEAEPPDEPTGLEVSVESGVGVNLTWDDPSDDTITGYEVLRRDRKIHGPGVFVTIDSDTGSADTAYTDATVKAGSSYVYRVKAINDHGVSDQSKNARADVPEDYEPPEPVVGGSATIVSPQDQDPVALPGTATGKPTISGSPISGETLTAGTSGIGDDDGITNAVYSYQWVRVDGANNETDIPDATTSTYTLVEADAGNRIKVTVSFTDDGGNSESVSSDPIGPVDWEEIWSATMTVGDSGEGTLGFTSIYGNLDKPTVSYKGTNYTVNLVTSSAANMGLIFQLVGSGFGDRASVLVLEVDGAQFRFADTSPIIGLGRTAYVWGPDIPSWTVNDTVPLRILRLPEPQITLTYRPVDLVSDNSLRVGDEVGSVAVGLRAEAAGDVKPSEDFQVLVRSVEGEDDTAAQAGQDYVAFSQTYTFRAGEFQLESGVYVLTVTHNLVIIDDDIVEKTENIQLHINTSALPEHVSVPAGEAVGTIEIRDEDVTTISVVSPAPVEEGDDIVLTVRIDKPAAFEFNVAVALLSGTAKVGDDFLVNREGAIFNAGDLEATLRIQTVDDDLAEGEESFRLRLLDNGLHQNVNLADQFEVTATILDDDEPEITLSFRPVALVEVDGHTVDEEVGTVAVGLRAQTAGHVKPSEDFQVVVQASGGTAEAGQDYMEFSRTYSFSSGEFQLQDGIYVLTVTHDLQIIDDAITEVLQEYLGLYIDTSALPEHVTVPSGENVGFLEILDSDQTTVRVVPPDPPVEGEDVVLLFMVDKPVPFDFQFPVFGISDTATGVVDFDRFPGSAIFNAGDMEVTFRISTVEDDLDEDDETFRIEWAQSGLIDRILLPEPVTATILDDDHSPVVETPSSRKTPDHSKGIITLQATDDDGDDLSWEIIDGVDRSLFRLTGDGELSFRARQSHDSPGDSNGDGIYHVTVRVTDGTNNAEHSLSIELVGAVSVDNVTRWTAEVTVYALPGNDGETMYLQYGSSHTWNPRTRQRTVTDGTAVFPLGGMEAGTRYKVRATLDVRSTRDPAPLRYEDWQRAEFQTDRSLVYGPEWLRATPTGDGGYELTWKPPNVVLPDGVDDITGYRIVRFDMSGRHPKVTLTSNAQGTSYTDPGPLASGQVYYYIWAMNGDGPSFNGATWVRVVPKASQGFGTPPRSPRNLQRDRSVSNGQVKLDWDAPEDESVAGYVITLEIGGDTRPDGGYREVELGSTGETTYTDDLTLHDFPDDGHILRTYRVYAVNDDGLRSWRATLNVPIIDPDCEGCPEDAIRPPSPVVESAEIDGDTMILRFDRELRHNRLENDDEDESTSLHFGLWTGDKPRHTQVAGYVTSHSSSPDQYPDTFSLSGRKVTLTFAEAVPDCDLWVTYEPGDGRGPLDDGSADGSPVRRFVVQAINLSPTEKPCRAPDLDIDANTRLRGLHSHGGTMFGSNNLPDHDHIYAYDLSTKARDTGKEFAIPWPNSEGIGIWSNGQTMWVADTSLEEVFAYHLTDGPGHDYGDRDTGREFDLHSDNDTPAGIWSNGRTMWVADLLDGKIYAYKMTPAASFGERDEGKDITLATENAVPRGIWSDGQTMLVVDGQDDFVYAYDLTTKTRDEDKEFSVSEVVDPYGIWSNGEVVWVAYEGFEPQRETIYAYRLPEGFLD